MAYRHHNAARARWLGVGVTIDEELKTRFRERVRAITRPSQCDLVKVDPAVRAYLLSISDEEVAS